MLTVKDLNKLDIPQQDNYEKALEIGLDNFYRRDPEWIASKVGAYVDSGKLFLPHLNMRIRMDLETRKFFIQETGKETPIWLSILCLHYMNSAAGEKPRGRLKHFREFKDGSFYEVAFNRRTKDILIEVYGADPSAMIEAGKKLGGKVLNNGDAAVELPYFPFLPITCVVWKGDEEFPPEASALFDETAGLYFSAEDMAVAAQMAVIELIRYSKR